jgi:dipeptidyl aminopeptidase/acylaminoacyl peptidase
MLRALRWKEDTVVRIALVAPLALLVVASAAAQPSRLTLEQIMADPGWIGAPVENAYWAADGKSVYYELKRGGSPIHDLHRVDLADGKDATIDAGAMAAADGSATVYDDAGTRAAFVRNGDIFLRDLPGGRLTQVTRTADAESTPQFSADGRRLSFRVGHDWLMYDLASGITAPAAILKAEKDPDAAPKPEALRDMQLRIFSTLQKIHNDKNASREHAQTLQRDDPTRAPLPFWLGDDVQIIETTLAPDAHWLIAVTAPKNADEGKKGKLTRYVTESGYEEFEDERTRVGLNDPAPQTLWLFDLVKHTSAKLGYDDLPGIHDDPLKAIRNENSKAGELPKKDEKNESNRKEKDEQPKPEAKPKQRELQIASVEFSRDGANAAVQLHANDNKDRWIATVDFAHHVLVPQHRLTDPAWINWSFNEFGWERDNRTLWYVSEESGYAHLYTKALGAKAQALTHGTFEVAHPLTSADGRWFYLRANAEAPYSYDIYRVAVGGGALQRLTRYQGAENFALSHDGANLLVTHSASYVPAQIAIVGADGSGTPRELTDTRTGQYKAMQWVAPQLVQVPSTHFKGVIHAKFYAPAGFDKARLDKSEKHPAVMFVHGAGYTQNVHQMFPYYFREQMFHNLLLQQGYLVLDMDYRASEGYGRDWRDAIYRNMGHPELEDLLDGKAWLVQNWNIDPQRVGMYGGSYGGFMTLMALFRAPGEFAAGAALRPVTDWAQYNDDYTADILNRPQVDPLAYKRSSPIEFADGLKDALLICHGVLDDNVLFADSMRLYQRLIELHKDNFTISPYPLDRHGFSNADSWLDEYKRIYRLFEANLKPHP